MNRIPTLCKISQPTMSSWVPFIGSSLQAHIRMDVSPHEDTAPLILPDQCKLILQYGFSPYPHKDLKYITTPAFPQMSHGIFKRMSYCLLLKFQHLSNQTHIFIPLSLLESPFIQSSKSETWKLSYVSSSPPPPTSNQSLSLSLPTKHFLNWSPFLHPSYLSF